MFKNSLVLQVLQELSRLHQGLREILRIEDYTECTFYPSTTLDSIHGDCYLNGWKKLTSWNEEHPDDYQFVSPILQDLEEEAFEPLKHAIINRIEFEEKLKCVCDEIAQCKKQFVTQIHEKRAELEQIYDAFAKSNKQYKFIFEAPEIKKLIIESFLGYR